MKQKNYNTLTVVRIGFKT